jgi:GNAT superfamily N-acetyltransferase
MAQDISLPTTYTLPNGQSVTIRPIHPNDAPLLVTMYHRLSKRTRRLRFHSYTGNLPKERIWREAIALSDLDPARQAALVAVHQDDRGERIAAVARFARAQAEDIEAEAAIVVRDDFQRMGLGSHMLTLLVPMARAMGIEKFSAWVMSENMHMLHIIQKANLPIRRLSRAGEVHIIVSLEPRAL